MKLNREELRRRALDKQREVDALKSDPRYTKTIGLLVHAGLLDHSRIRPSRGLVTVEDALWAGQLEPRIYELLPAILLKRPKLFARTRALPEDLAQVLNDVRRGKPTRDFRGIPPRNYAAWVTRIGRAGKMPSLLKTFRFTEADLHQIGTIQLLTGDSETDIIRKGMELYYRSLVERD